MDTRDFDYYLPEELIAQEPLKDRSASRMMKLDKQTGEIKHESFKNIVNYLDENCVLVLNNTRVLPARLYGIKEETDAHIEILLLKRIDMYNWQILVKPAKRAKIGTVIRFSDRLSGTISKEEDEGIRYIKFDFDGVFEDIIYEIGSMPLPPYIHHKLDDKERYQTVYSKINGSSAAPTAGLHFTDEILGQIKNKGIEIEYVTLHVGLGTFRPVKVDKIEEHHMHSEYYNIDEDVAKRLNEARKNGKKIVAVGTTTVRTLESASNKDGELTKLSDNTNIFIFPPYKFKFVDSIITNFHLPMSTLIMMISAFAGKDKLFHAYEEAVKNKYRFFSFGDCMFID